MTGVLAVDPPGCGCTECLTGVYVPLDRATPSQVAAAARGVLGNNTGFGRSELAARSLPRVPDEVQEIHARIRAHDRDGVPVPDFRLRCPFCRGELSVTMGTVGGTYLSYEVPDCLECEDCGAEWETNGDLRRAPYPRGGTVVGRRRTRRGHRTSHQPDNEGDLMDNDTDVQGVIARLKAERDEARDTARRAIAYGGQLESERDRYRAALEEITRPGPVPDGVSLRACARAALETTTKETTT